MTDIQKTQHIPVLLHDVIATLSIKPDDCVVDGTLGGGGYARAILSCLGKNGVFIGIDADERAHQRVSEEFRDDKRATLFVNNFRNIDEVVAHVGCKTVNKIVLDLGLSSDQLESSGGRGFSFLVDEPLKMTFSSQNTETGQLTAWHVVNEWSEETLSDILYAFGEESHAKKIAHGICVARRTKSIDTSLELAQCIEKILPRRGKSHPATKTFQAIRIVVNDEIGALEEVLQKGKMLLVPKGRIAIVTFHSLEDRMVKRVFRTWEDEGFGTRITKRPIMPSRSECVENRRARSAKLRCFEKGVA